MIDITDPKCKQCPINAKCLACEYMMEKVKEMREKNKHDSR
jgi:adenine-specific DNA glycosylase